MIPSSDKEAVLSLRGAIRQVSYTKFADTDHGNIEVYVQEDDDTEPETITLAIYETGESIPSHGEYVGTVNGFNRYPAHVYRV